MTRPDPRMWWQRASSEQKLAQIDGALECGMTLRQTALVSGMSGSRQPIATLGGFAGAHGRKFPRRSTASDRRRAAVDTARRSYLAGEPFGSRAAGDEFVLEQVEC